MRKEMNTPLCTPISVEELLFYFGFLRIMQSPVFEHLSITSIWWECETLCGEDMQLSSHVRVRKFCCKWNYTAEIPTS
ncbi:hypothetical protein SDJN03_25151, partial [Cucurbita argyrosperma subsp. sororia]